MSWGKIVLLKKVWTFYMDKELAPWNKNVLQSDYNGTHVIHHFSLV